MPNGIARFDLPEKTCPTCNRPFVWRKNGPKTGIR
ncbi:hypothetical protein BH09PSE3_BH09PSE3_05680 [soil metagenome]